MIGSGFEMASDRIQDDAGICGGVHRRQPTGCLQMGERAV